MLSSSDPADLPEASVHDHPADHILEAWCPQCGKAVDAACPHCQHHVEPGGTVGSGTATGAGLSTLDRVEFYRRLVLLIVTARNSKFMIGCYLIATGDAFADGISMTDFAKLWSVKKATVSKTCNIICSKLEIPPSQYMRRAETKDHYRQANRRPTKMG